ncbi:hypothetical protein INT45_011136 [Circinella minor]|uniref:Uncharacterized protein n=1 Tax=Circinella minor TaxID=1195481 RepID=A0A8H7SDI0_9FUNG|nr:hypothetical protein INT45_011136 [Circinella minor]
MSSGFHCGRTKKLNQAVVNEELNTALEKLNSRIFTICFLLRKIIYEAVNYVANQFTRILANHCFPITLHAFRDDIDDDLTRSLFNLEANSDQNDERAD